MMRVRNEGQMGRAKIGFVTCVHPLYDLPAVAAWRESAIEELQKAGAEVLATAVPRTAEEGRATGAQLREAGVDLAVLFFCSWVSEEVTLGLAGEIGRMPLLLWALPYLDRDIPMPSPMSGLTGSGSNIRRTGKSFAHVIGGVNGETVGEVTRAAAAGAAVTALGRARMGVVGSACPGMVDVEVDEEELQARLGVKALHFPLDELVGAARRAPLEAAREAAGRLTAATGGRRELSEEALVENMRLYVAIREMVEENGLDAYCLRCWPELRNGLGLTPCAAHALMAADGVASTCEVDVTALITTWLLSRLAGKAAFNFDITGFLEGEDAIQFGHCGAADPSLAGDPRKALLRVHMRTATGATVEFPFREGTATLAKLMRPSGGRMRLFAARGEVVATEEGVRGSVATVRPEPSARAFVGAMMALGVEHHIALVYGDWRRELELFCAFTGTEYVEAGRG